MGEPIYWNDQVKLVLADVDETIADVYTPAELDMIAELDALLGNEKGPALFLVSGGSLGRIQRDITDRLLPLSRRKILISHCSGAEVWGFEADGSLRVKPFYSLYEETFTQEMRDKWRETVKGLLEEFHLRIHSVRPKPEFWETVGHDPHDIMYDDRGPQITLEVVNGIDLSDEQMQQFERDIPLTHGQRDLRVAILERADQLFRQSGVPITPRLGGNFAVDLALEGVSKTTSIKRIIEDDAALANIGLRAEDLLMPDSLEIWGDKFSAVRGGTDRHMSEAVPKRARSIDFRREDPAEFLPGYNTVIWGGKHYLHHGLLEYLRSRPRA